MIKQGLTTALAILSAGLVSAEELTLQSPVDCVLGETCYIQQYMDRDPTSGVKDFRCRALSYDGHKGTDFAIPTRADMVAGVNVLAAADGQVRGVRDGMPDNGFTPETAAAIEGKECGNGVVLQHEGEWETQYCHLKNGSIAVESGQAVSAGDVLGQIGMSGRTQFPHLHISVRHKGNHIDPFDPDGTLDCAATGDTTLWADAPRYQPGGIIDIGIATAVPAYDDIKAGTAKADRLSSDAPALVLFGFTFGTLKNDVLRLSIFGPKGEVIAQDQVLPRNHAQAFRAAGKKRRRNATWPEGAYTGTVTLLREENIIDSNQIEFSIPTAD